MADATAKDAVGAARLVAFAAAAATAVAAGAAGTVGTATAAAAKVRGDFEPMAVVSVASGAGHAVAAAAVATGAAVAAVVKDFAAARCSSAETPEKEPFAPLSQGLQARASDLSGSYTNPLMTHDSYSEAYVSKAIVKKEPMMQKWHFSYYSIPYRELL